MKITNISLSKLRQLLNSFIRILFLFLWVYGTKESFASSRIPLSIESNSSICVNLTRLLASGVDVTSITGSDMRLLQLEYRPARGRPASPISLNSVAFLGNQRNAAQLLSINGTWPSTAYTLRLIQLRDRERIQISDTIVYSSKLSFKRENNS